MFVVQAANFREMADFVAIGREAGADGVDFSRLRNEGTYTPEAFAAVNVMDPQHKEHSDFLAMIASIDGRLDEEKIAVDLGDLREFLGYARRAVRREGWKA
jgi:hypothetical protein